MLILVLVVVVVGHEAVERNLLTTNFGRIVN